MASWYMSGRGNLLGAHFHKEVLHVTLPSSSSSGCFGSPCSFLFLRAFLGSAGLEILAVSDGRPCFFGLLYEETKDKKLNVMLDIEREELGP